MGLASICRPLPARAGPRGSPDGASTSGCDKARLQLLDMVQLRLRQWSLAPSQGPEAWPAGIFTRSIEPLWSLAAAEPALAWRLNSQLRPIRRQRTIARDLLAAVIRFNRRWEQFCPNN